MVKDFYLVFSQRYNPTKGYSHQEYWNYSNALIVVETSESKAIKKAREDGCWIEEDINLVNKKGVVYKKMEKDILSCLKLDIKKYKTGDIVIQDFGDDG